MKVVKNNLNSIAAQLARETDIIANKTTTDIKASIIESMTGQKSGKVYEVQGKKHQASAPGEAPARDTGNLINSITIDKAANAHYIINFGAEYAVRLEYGTGRIQPRPFARPAVKKHQYAFHAALRQLQSRLK